MAKRYKLQLMHIDTDKLAKAVTQNILIEKQRIVEEGSLIVESEQNIVLLKNKLGIRDDAHITELDTKSEPKVEENLSENLSDKEPSEKGSTKDESEEVVKQGEVMLISDKVSNTRGENNGNSGMQERQREFNSNYYRGGYSNGMIKLEVPILKAYDFDTIQDYIADLKRAKEYGQFQSDKDLIFSSLVKSDKTKLYNERYGK